MAVTLHGITIQASETERPNTIRIHVIFPEMTWMMQYKDNNASDVAAMYYVKNFLVVGEHSSFEKYRQDTGSKTTQKNQTYYQKCKALVQLIEKHIDLDTFWDDVQQWLAKEHQETCTDI